MNRRHVLTLLIGAAAGCSTQQTDPTATPPPSETAEPTAEQTVTATATPTPPDEEETPIPTELEGFEAAVTALNDVYAELRPTLETLEVSGLDYVLLADRLETTAAALASISPADDAEAERVRALSDTRWIFDRLVRSLTRVREAYGVHAQLFVNYRGNVASAETSALVGELQTLATEASNSAGTAVSRYDSLDEFDAALDVQFDSFEDELFRVSDTVQALTPIALGLRRAIPARSQYLDAVALYDEESYREGQNAFADLLSSFSRAREQFDAADESGVTGPLEPFLADYLCESESARLACVEYRAACREQLDGNAERAQRRRQQGDRRYTECVLQAE